MAVLAMNRSYNLDKFKKAKSRRLFRKRRGCWYIPFLLHLRNLNEFIPPTWAGSLKCVHMCNFHPTKVRSHQGGIANLPYERNLILTYKSLCWIDLTSVGYPT